MATAIRTTPAKKKKNHSIGRVLTELQALNGVRFLEPDTDDIVEKRCSVFAYIGYDADEHERSYSRQVEVALLDTQPLRGKWPDDSPTQVWELELGRPLQVEVLCNGGCSIKLDSPHELIGLARALTLLAIAAHRQGMISFQERAAAEWPSVVESVGSR
jgi:hypothetical protein